jgi:hypothetical protein
MFDTWKYPSMFVAAPRPVPTMLTDAPTSGSPVSLSVTVPSRMPVVPARRGGAQATRRVARSRPALRSEFFRGRTMLQGFSGFIWGKKRTSRMDSCPVSSMVSRSIPMPRPAAGGMPYSRARIKSSSRTWASR